MNGETPFKAGPSVGGQATTGASAGALLPGVVDGPAARSVLRIANKGLYSFRLELGTDPSVLATVNSQIFGPGDTEFQARGVFTHFSIMGVAREAISGIDNGTTDYSITAGDGV